MNPLGAEFFSAMTLLESRALEVSGKTAFSHSILNCIRFLALKIYSIVVVESTKLVSFGELRRMLENEPIEHGIHLSDGT